MIKIVKENRAAIELVAQALMKRKRLQLWLFRLSRQIFLLEIAIEGIKFIIYKTRFNDSKYILLFLIFKLLYVCQNSTKKVLVV